VPANAPEVFVGNAHCLGDADGAFRFEGLTPGEYRLFARSDADGSVGRATVLLEAALETPVAVRLEPQTWAHVRSRGFTSSQQGRASRFPRTPPRSSSS
jgi:hypothetical protein